MIRIFFLILLCIRLQPEKHEIRVEQVMNFQKMDTVVQKMDTAIFVKYLTDDDTSSLSNVDLLEFINDWYHVPYVYGGTSKGGLDCSAFSQTLLYKVYNHKIPRVANDQWLKSKKIKKAELRQGDLVFFHTFGSRGRVTHVGVYLTNNKFIQASRHGVIISSLSDPYYKKRYIGAGRYN